MMDFEPYLNTLRQELEALLLGINGGGKKDLIIDPYITVHLNTVAGFSFLKVHFCAYY